MSQGEYIKSTSVSFRAFIAVDVKLDDRLVLVLNSLRKTEAYLKLVNPNNLHITLKFLGDIQESIVSDIINIIQESIKGKTPFSIKMHGIGAFPNMKHISVVWSGIYNSEQLVEIAEYLDLNLERMGFRPETRKFSPHLTLARMKGSRDIDSVQKVITDNINTDFGEILLNSIKLKKSVLTPKGPIYSTIQDIHLE